MALADNAVASSREMLRRSEKELEAGGLSKASKKAWTALAIRFDAIARARNWHHGEMDHYTLMVDKLMCEVAHPKEFVGLFGQAFSLHFNQYSNCKTARQVTGDVNAVKKLLAMLEEIG